MNNNHETTKKTWDVRTYHKLMYVFLVLDVLIILALITLWWFEGRKFESSDATSLLVLFMFGGGLLSSRFSLQQKKQNNSRL